MDWTSKIKQGLELPGKFLAHSGHAQQAIPGQHRILNAGAMGLGWWSMDKIRHYVFGFEQKSEGEFVEVRRDDVPAPLRFLHKTIEWDPHSETAENQWKKLAYQTFPAVGATLALGGSMMSFQLNGRMQKFKQLKEAKSLDLMDADAAAQFAQATPLWLLTAFFSTFSAASGLTFLYGLFLNSSFAAANGARVFTGSLAKGNVGPAKALEVQLGSISSYVKQAVAKPGGKISEDWADQFVKRVLEPLFGHELNTPAAQEKARQTLQKIVEESYHKFESNGRPAKEIAEAVANELTQKLDKAHIGGTLRKEFGLDPTKATLGNANPFWDKTTKMLGLKQDKFQQKLRNHYAAVPSETSL